MKRVRKQERIFFFSFILVSVIISLFILFLFLFLFCLVLLLAVVIFMFILLFCHSYSIASFVKLTRKNLLGINLQNEKEKELLQFISDIDGDSIKSVLLVILIVDIVKSHFISSSRLKNACIVLCCVYFIVFFRSSYLAFCFWRKCV